MGVGLTEQHHRYDAVVNNDNNSDPDIDNDDDFMDNYIQESEERDEELCRETETTSTSSTTTTTIVFDSRKRSSVNTNWVIAIFIFSLTLGISLVVLKYTSHGWNTINNIHTNPVGNGNNDNDDEPSTTTPTTIPPRPTTQASPIDPVDNNDTNNNNASSTITTPTAIPTPPTPQGNQNTNQETTTTTVQTDIPNFPSFLSFQGEPIDVSFDNRAIKLNGKRSLFLGGSMHPSRTTRGTWNHALDKAVRNGLNLITIYTFWKEHQPYHHNGRHRINPNMNFSLSSQNWELKDALQAAGDRGLFIHLRIGPYVCAEYNYGGIPEWVPLSDSDMKMRRYNDPWLSVMKKYVQEMTNYITFHKLWAYQGGPIILGQIENELGSDEKKEQEELQKYADWCGDLVQELQPNVVWTMCNGISSSNTINTCNGYGSVSCSRDWLENHGQSSKIQKDHPALWTEDEGGFQIWGSNATHPSDYFWGQSSQRMVRDALQWFARGGSHLNYYMWYGGYNRGTMAAAGITNAYAMDAPLCPDGQEHYPKYLQLQKLHSVLANLAQALMESPTALHHEEPVEVWSYGASQWLVPTSGTDKQRAFVYNSTTTTGETNNGPIYFIENDSSHLTTIRMPGTSGKNTIGLSLNPHSSVIIRNKQVLFNSAHDDRTWTSFTRQKHTIYGKDDEYDDAESNSKLIWETWPEPIGPAMDDNDSNGVVFTDNIPIEQNQLMVESHANTNFAWYDVEFDVTMKLKDTALCIETTQGIAFSVYLDGTYVGSVQDTTHGDDSIQLNITNLGTMEQDTHHVISILSESFGNGNLIGRWNASTTAKQKGLVGDVTLVGVSADGQTQSLDLVPKKEDSSNSTDSSSSSTIWKSQSGLNSNDQIRRKTSASSSKEQDEVVVPPLTWLRTQFSTPVFASNNQTLLLGITSGRGKLFLNGYDLGMFWNITSHPSNEDYTQKYYQLPFDWLVDTNSDHENELVIFSTMELDTSRISMILTWVQESPDGHFPDVVSYLGACM